MIRISGIGVKNLRSLKALDEITFKPINILVGKNSAGKSTFARLLPLLKQSSENRKQSPILWWGRLVDFGTFEDVYSSLSDDGFIEIGVGFEVTETLFLYRTPYFREPNIPFSKPGHIKATFRLGRDSQSGQTILRELGLDVFGVSVRLIFGASNVTEVYVEGKSIEIPSNVRLTWQQGSLMPILRSVNAVPVTQSLSDESLFLPRRFSRFGALKARSAVSRYVHGNTQDDRKEEIADRLPLAPVEDFLRYCRRMPNSTVTWKNIFSETTEESINLKELHSAIVLFKLDSLLLTLDDAAQRYLAGVSYLEPLRATAQRYYRRDEISADELDPKGLNTPFFIQGLTDRERESLNEWTRQNFGFSLSTKMSGGHVSLNIQSQSDIRTNRNMADVGLGYSQIVPVALQLWAAKNRRANDGNRKSPSLRRALQFVGRTVVVEQPELHLHPAYQARLADVFAVSVGKSVDPNDDEPNLTIVAETHSPNLISRLGELIVDGKLSAEMVQILVFEDGAESKSGTSVRIARFDDEGVLKNWPIGFFDA